MAAAAPRLFVDHYAVLGVEPMATAEEIRRAFRKRARLVHPDVAGGDPIRFIELYTSYRTLQSGAARSSFDRLRSALQRQVLSRRHIPASRLRFPVTVAAFARYGLLRARVRSGERRRFFNIDCDLELQLYPSELTMPLAVQVPLTVRSLCPECMGSDRDCEACSGKGSYKICRPLTLHLDGGLAHGQLLELKLDGLRPGRMSHYKKRRLRIKITVVRRP